MDSRVRILAQEIPPLGKVVLLLIGDDWRCYIWQGDRWGRFDEEREALPDDRWKPAPPPTSINYRQPT